MTDYIPRQYGTYDRRNQNPKKEGQDWDESSWPKLTSEL